MTATERPVVSIDRHANGSLLVSDQELDAVVVAALANKTGRARINAHTDLGESIHEMLIAFRGRSYDRPHRHRLKRESFHVIRGRLDALTFDDLGQVKERIPLGPPGSGYPFFLRNEHNDWHCFAVLSDVAIVHETTNGPFNPEESEFPTWAPDPGDVSAVNRFLADLY